MSGWPDHAAARCADDADGDVENPVAAEPGEPGAAQGATADGVDGGRIPDDVAAVAAQRDDYLESLQRLKADFDNYRKRVARLQEEQSARAEAGLVSKLLHVIDNLDLAWAHLGPGDAGPGDGAGDGAAISEEARAITQARDQLLDVLGREGLERVDAVGVPFDPTVHDAVAHAEVGAGGGSGASEAVGENGAVGENEAVGENGVGDDPAIEEAAPHAVCVEEVLRAGYRWRGQVLRPAMVRVRG
ncbi:MAG: nucleotide exchange factor GrpE [Acidimicrobiales bacterium]